MGICAIAAGTPTTTLEQQQQGSPGTKEESPVQQSLPKLPVLEELEATRSPRKNHYQEPRNLTNIALRRQVEGITEQQKRQRQVLSVNSGQQNSQWGSLSFSKSVTRRPLPSWRP
ncbi:hypothetical protein OTU49_012769, partial [Cherax quadricarinatus]